MINFKRILVSNCKISISFLIFFLAFNLTSRNSIGQSSIDNDSLNTYFNKQIKVVVQNIRSKPDSMLLLCDHLETVASQLGNDSLKAILYLRRGDIFLEKGDYNNAKIQVNQITKYNESLRSYYTQASRLSRIARNVGDFELAIKLGLENVKRVEELGDSIALTSVYGDLAIIFGRLKDFDKSIEYSTKRIAISKTIGYKKGEFLGHYGVAQYLKDRENERKLYHLNEAIAINKNHIKNSYYESVLELLKAQNLYFVEDYENAIVLFRGQYDAVMNSQNVEQKLFMLEAYARCYLKINEPLKAIPLLNEAYRISSDIDEIETMENVSRKLSEAYAQMGNYAEAYDFLKKNETHKDSFLNLEKITAINEINEKYETVKKDATLKNQEILLERKDFKIRLVSLIAGFILLGGLALFYGIRKRNSYKLSIKEKSIALKNQKINDLEKEKKILAMASMLEGQEAERNRIAQDLHDGLGGLLASVKTHFSLIQGEIEKLEQFNVYQKANDMIDQACGEVRKISQNLMPNSLRVNGLVSAAEFLISDLIDVHQINVDFQTPGDHLKRLTESEEIFIYRILQESMNNIVKHAKAENILIQLGAYEQEYLILIEDDGVGFDTKADYLGHGLSSIRSRVEHLNGTIDIESTTGEGTAITINIPIHGTEN